MGLDGDLEIYIYIYFFFPQSVIAFKIEIKEIDNWFAHVDQNIFNMIPKKLFKYINRILNVINS